MSHVPTGVGVFQNVDNAGLVANVSGIVESEEIAMVVEGQFLRVAQAHGMDFQPGTIRLATKDRSPARSLVHLAGSIRDVIAAVTDGKVQPAIEASYDAVEVMTDEGDPHPIAFGDRNVIVGHAVVVLVGHFPDRGDTGEIDGVGFCEDGKPYAVQWLVEMVGKQTALVGRPVAIGILQTDESIGHLGIPLGILVLGTRTMAGDMLVIQFLTVLHRDRPEISPRHLLGSTQIGHTEPKTVGFRHEETTARVDAQAGRVFNVRVSRPSMSDVTIVLDGAAERGLLVLEGRHLVLADGERFTVGVSEEQENGGKDKNEGSHVEKG